MGATVKVREKYQITIPEDVRAKIPLQVGERVESDSGGRRYRDPPDNRGSQGPGMVLEQGVAGADCPIQKKHRKGEAQGI